MSRHQHCCVRRGPLVQHTHVCHISNACHSFSGVAERLQHTYVWCSTIVAAGGRGPQVPTAEASQMGVDRGAWYGGDDGKVICGSDAMLYAAGKRCSWGIDGADWQQERRAGGDGAAQGRVIVSADIGGEHGDSGKVSQLADRMWKSGADIIKIRARPSSVMDSLRMLQFVQGQPGTHYRK